MEKCEKTQKCKIMPRDHPHCDGGEFSSLRLIILCAIGKPTEPLNGQSMQMGCTKNSQGQCVDTTKDDESKVRLTATLPYGGDGAETTILSGGGGDGRDSTSTVEPFVVEIAAQMGEVQHQVKKEVENPFVMDIELVPCYRWHRTTKIFKRHEIFGNWKHYEFLARLTNCGHEEGCFMVKFPHGTIYNDAKVEPASSEIAKGELEKADDHFWVTWRGIGLKRIDYNTWGVCLPKTRTME